MNPADLVAAWKRWDAKPGGSWEAHKMEDACQQWATEHDLSCTDLRRRMAKARRAGLSYTDALSP